MMATKRLKRLFAVLAVFTVIGLCSIGFVACSQAHDETLGSQSSELAMLSRAPLWNDGGDGHTLIHIPVCFWLGDSTATMTHVDWAKYALTNSWNNTTNVVFDFQMCLAVPNGTKQVVVWISDGCCGKTLGRGPSVLFDVALLGPSRYSVWLPTSATGLTADGGGGAKLTPISQQMFMGVTVHEFGHVLGFEHEQDQDAGFFDENYVPVNEGGNSLCAPNPGKAPDGGTNPFWPDRLLTAYDPDSIMNYCHQIREYSGRLSDLDIQGVQAVYGTPGRLDSDGDQTPDRTDRCPYVKDDQTDSNFDAELAYQRTQGFTASDEGHVPTPQDTQQYVDHWHASYKGDVCDPVAVTGMTTIVMPSQVRPSGPCEDLYVGGITSRSGPNYSETCPEVLTSGIRFNSYVGGPAGLAGAHGGQTAPAFCECPFATSLTPAIKVQCQASPFFCSPGQDFQFPPLDGTPPSFKWVAITIDSNGFDRTFQYSDISTSHFDPMDNSAASGVDRLWDFRNDVATFNHPLAYNDLTGALWSHVGTYNFGYIKAPFAKANMQDAYVGVDAHYDIGTKVHWVPPFNVPWGRIPYCNPYDPVVQHEWGIVPYMVTGVNSGVTYAVSTTDTAQQDITTQFIGTGVALLNMVASGMDMLVADDAVNGMSSAGAAPGALVVVHNTTQIAGAFVTNGTKLDGQLANVPSQSTTTLRSYSAIDGNLYSLESAAGQWKLASRNVARALAGTPTLTQLNVTGVVPSSPRAAVWSTAGGGMFVIDYVVVGSLTTQRLLLIDNTGLSTQLWATQSTSGTAPTPFLAATREGTIILSESGLGDGSYHVMTMASNGMPIGSTFGTGNLQSGVVGDAAGITIPVDQIMTDSQPNISLRYVTRAGLTAGVCGSPYFMGIANPNVGTGALTSGTDCTVAPIPNGGFETGDFRTWTQIASPTITTVSHTGSYAAMLGSASPTNGDTTVQSQTFTVPATGGTLTLWYNVTCPDTVTYDWFVGQLLTPSGALIATVVPKTCVGSSGWTQVNFDLTPYAGQTLVFAATNHDDNYPGDPTYTLVDDISVH